MVVLDPCIYPYNTFLLLDGAYQGDDRLSEGREGVCSAQT